MFGKLEAELRDIHRRFLAPEGAPAPTTGEGASSSAPEDNSPEAEGAPVLKTAGGGPHGSSALAEEVPPAVLDSGVRSCPPGTSSARHQADAPGGTEDQAVTSVLQSLEEGSVSMPGRYDAMAADVSGGAAGDVAGLAEIGSVAGDEVPLHGFSARPDILPQAKVGIPTPGDIYVPSSIGNFWQSPSVGGEGPKSERPLPRSPSLPDMAPIAGLADAPSPAQRPRQVPAGTASAGGERRTRRNSSVLRNKPPGTNLLDSLMALGAVGPLEMLALELNLPANKPTEGGSATGLAEAKEAAAAAAQPHPLLVAMTARSLMLQMEHADPRPARQRVLQPPRESAADMEPLQPEGPQGLLNPTRSIEISPGAVAMPSQFAAAPAHQQRALTDLGGYNTAVSHGRGQLRGVASCGGLVTLSRGNQSTAVAVASASSGGLVTPTRGHQSTAASSGGLAGVAAPSRGHQGTAAAVAAALGLASPDGDQQEVKSQLSSPPQPQQALPRRFPWRFEKEHVSSMQGGVLRMHAAHTGLQ